MSGKLNIFQRTMLQWNELYPYNAVHVVKIPRRLETARLTRVLNSLLETCGLTHLAVDEKRGTFHYHGGPSSHAIKIIQGEGDATPALSSEIELQLNTPFVRAAAIDPFRFFVLPGEDSFYLGLVYLHPISGAESIVFLLKGIVNAYMDKDAPGSSPRLDLYPKCYLSLFRIRPKSLIGWIRTLPSFISDLRSSFRARYRDFGDHTVGFSFFSVGPDRFHTLVRAGKLWGVTLNDIFLALLLKSLSPFALDRIDEPRRKMISVASIVNIRKDLSLELHDPFGLFLGSFIVSHSVPDGIEVEALAKDVRRQTLRIKKYRLSVRTAIGLGLARHLVPLLSPSRRKKFYPKYYPLWGGITNVNLNALWQEGDGGVCPDYLRAVSTGPASPLVLSITTVNDILNIGVSFKTTVFGQDDVEKIMRSFSDSLDTLGVAA